ncbi:MAG: methyltransferase domain-containing protein [Acidimicrobiia bacterium]|nr:methyltransferase domain-containing protein [Acidimicrobiia bacterium]
MARPGDAFGEALLEFLDGRGPGAHIIERDDGLVEGMPSVEPYFGGPDGLAEIERQAIELIGDRVLDIGAGAGRFSLAAQARGAETVALDDSAGAIEVCRRRGVDRVINESFHSYQAEERFDTFLMMGHNLGLLAPDPARTLNRLAAMAMPGAVILGTSLDPYATEEPTHLEYHEANRARGRRGGHLVLRVRTKRLIGPWFDYLFSSFAELADLASQSGWEATIVASDDVRYLAALRLRV